jgi:ribosome-binding factor A
VAHVVRDIVAEAMREKLSDPRIERLTSITRVEISPDLSSAHIHVSVMADETHRKLTLTALQHSAGRLRSLIAQQVSMRTVPWLTFHLDDSIRRGFETVQTIDRLMEELRPAADPSDQPTIVDAESDVVAPVRRDGAHEAPDEHSSREDS